MSYQVLSLKWRPQAFDDVVGQNHVTKTLINAFKKDRVAQAYILTGPRGVGKTTTARIISKALNCPKTKSGVPCNKCNICQEIIDGRNLDASGGLLITSSCSISTSKSASVNWP